MTAVKTKPQASANGDSPTHPPAEIEAVRGEVVEDGQQSKVLLWHGADLVLPAELPAWWMFDVFEAQSGDDTALVRGIYGLVGKDQWAKARSVALEQNLPADEFHKLIDAVMSAYGMGGAGESSASGDSSETGGEG